MRRTCPPVLCPRPALWVGLLGLALIGPACKPKPPLVGPPGNGTIREPPPPPKAEDENAARALADEAKALLTQGDRDGAAKKLDLLVELYPGTAAGALELVDRARAAASAGELLRAVELYERVLFHRPTLRDGDRVREEYANLLQQADRPGDAANMLRYLFEQAEDLATRERIGLRLAESLSRTGQPGAALAICMALRAAPGVSAATAEEVERRAFALVTSGLSFKEAEELWPEAQSKSTWAFVAPALGFRLAKIYYHVRDYERSEALLKLVSTRFSTSPYGGQARDFLARLHARFQVEPLTIGVVLPLSGRFQQYGARSLEAIKLAFAATPSVRLVVKDSGGEPTAAASAVESLVLDEHVIAIIGPMFSNEALAAALKAEELSVPILSLSHREGLPGLGPWVFRTALTVQAQARALVQVAFDELGMTRFALLYPRNTYGEEFAGYFWDEVEARKGEIRAAESYDYNQKTFQEPVRRLVGRYYLHAREDYLQFVRELRAQALPSHKHKMALEKFEKTLPPVVDFDAIVIPDSGRNLGLIAPAIAVEDIVLTRDPKVLDRIKKSMGRTNVKPISLLGASTWNSPQTLEHCEQYCNDAIFVDAYYPDSPEPKVREFVTAFRDKTGADANLSEAQAFDTAALVGLVLTGKKPTDRKAFRQALLDLPGHDGITGRLRFDEHGEVQKRLLTLTISGKPDERAIRLWVPADEPAG